MEAEATSTNQSQKRIRSETYTMKENVKQVPTSQSAKSLGKRRESSPLVAAAPRSNYTPVEENPFTRLSIDFPALSGNTDPSRVRPIRSSKYPDLLSVCYFIQLQSRTLLTTNRNHQTLSRGYLTSTNTTKTR